MEWWTTASGKKMPLDLDPHPDGTYTFNAKLNVITAPVHSKLKMYRSHFDTCVKRFSHPPRAFECDYEGCERTDRHYHCFRCGSLEHLADEHEED